MKKVTKLEEILKSNPSIDKELYELARVALEEVRDARPTGGEADDLSGEKDGCDLSPEERDRRAVIIRTSL